MALQPNLVPDSQASFEERRFNRRDLPSNQLAESEILSSIMQDQTSWDLVGSDLTVEDFVDIRNSHIFSSIESLAVEGKPFGLSDVSFHLQNSNKLEAAGGVEYLRQLSESISINLDTDLISAVKEIKKQSLLRQINSECTAICETINRQPNRDLNDTVEEVEARITALTQTSAFDIKDLDIRHQLHKVQEELDYIKEFGTSRRGIQSGFIGLDAKTNGFLKSSLFIIAARPGVGKTSLAINFVEKLLDPNNGESGIPILFFSLEQPSQEILIRLISSLANLSQTTLTRQRLSAQAEAQVESVMISLQTEEWGNRFLLEDRSGVTVASIRKQARAVKRTMGKLGLIIVDYLQLMQPDIVNKNDTRTRELSRITSGLKEIARDFEVPVIALSQLNRESENRKTKRPRLSDLRDSGAIEQDADVVVLLHREDIAKEKVQPDGKAELIIAKNRHGELGIVDLQFIGALTRFQTVHPGGAIQSQTAVADVEPPEQDPYYDDEGGGGSPADDTIEIDF